MGHVGAEGDERVDRQGGHLLGAVGVAGALGMNGCPGGGIGRNPVVEEGGKIERGVILVGYGDLGSGGVAGGDPVAKQRPVALAGNEDGIEAVSAGLISVAAIVGHLQRGPVGRIFEIRVWLVHPGRLRDEYIVRVGDKGRDVIAGLDDLVLQADRGETLRVGNLGGHHQRLSGGRLLRAVLNLADQWPGVG